MPTVTLAELPLPDFGLPTAVPAIPTATYEDRIDAARARAAAAGLDALVVYADREHSANLAYLTGYDPRFEEALLILVEDRVPVLVVGNEGWDYAAISPIRHHKVRYQTFSLLGQPRDDSPRLGQVFRDAGLRAGMRVGTVGWKYFDTREVARPELWLEIPSFIADVLRALLEDPVAGPARVVNATHLFMDPSDGLRAVSDVDQLAYFECAAAFASQSMRDMIFGLKPGMTGFDAVRLMGLNGWPLSAHLMLLSGADAIGLSSPSMRRIEVGDPLLAAVPLWGALIARAGFVVEDAGQLPPGIFDYVDKLVRPYFGAVAEWYAHVGLGVTGGELFDIVHRHLGDPFFGVGLNPGHLIHLDEWVHSPIYAGSARRLVSGMALQVDIIPATGTPYFTTNIEDGIALADAPLREKFAARYPEAWGRIQARRAYMSDVLGIRLKPEVLPFSNLPAYLPPYLLSPHMALALLG